ncbi:MAG TPA: alpha/beta fold hydrolase [Longilinea sp.]|nr:alpha/beta fold hydrolase [Longilinea sp.]
MKTPYLIPDGKPVLLPGGKTGCILVHGFTAMPKEMEYLSADLNQRGYSVLSVRLAGHGSQAEDLIHLGWRDWLSSVEDAYNLLKGICDKVILIGQSLGGIVVLMAASYLPVNGVVSLSTPCSRSSDRDTRWMKVISLLQPIRIKDRHMRVHPQDPRLEENYPAYPFYALHATIEVRTLQNILIDRLPLIKAPVLIAQSHTDANIPANSAGRIYTDLGSERKEMAWFEQMDHSMVRDPNRQQVFEAVAAFLSTL